MKPALAAIGLSIVWGLGGCGGAAQEPRSAPVAFAPEAPNEHGARGSERVRSKTEPRALAAPSLLDLVPPRNATKEEQLAWLERLRLWTGVQHPGPNDGQGERPRLPKLEDHRSALERQLAAGWGWRGDRDSQVRVPLVDWRNWKRVRLGNIDHLAAFKYTKDHHLVTGVFTVKTPGERPTSESCIHRFDERAAFELGRRGVTVGQVLERSIDWQKSRVRVRQTEGTARLFFTRYDFSAAWAAYPAYEDGCLVYATVVLWEDEPELARRVLERWITEGLGQTRMETPRVPSRKED